MQIHEWTYGAPPAFRIMLRVDTEVDETASGGLRLRHSFFVLTKKLDALGEEEPCGGYVPLGDPALVEETLAEGGDPLLNCFLARPAVRKWVLGTCPELFALIDREMLRLESEDARPDPAPGDGSIRL